jgi:hypothetical protein
LWLQREFWQNAVTPHLLGEQAAERPAATHQRRPSDLSFAASTARAAVAEWLVFGAIVGCLWGALLLILARDETSGRIKDVSATKRPLPRGDHSSGPRQPPVSRGSADIHHVL